MSQRHTDGMIPEWFDELERAMKSAEDRLDLFMDTWETFLKNLPAFPKRPTCCSCLRPITTRYYHEDQNGGFWCDVCMARTPGLFWLRERDKG